MTRLDRVRWLGLAGSVTLAAGGTASGALPATDPFTAVPGLRDLRAHEGIGLFAAYLGLTLLIVAWWRAGQPAPGEPAPDVPRLRSTLAWWVAPLLLGPPLFSRDVYSYLAQGAMVTDGLDVYRAGPASLGGPLADEVAVMWQQTPAPYGPAFLLVAAGVVGLTGSHVVAGVLGLRLVAVAGVALLDRCVPRLAERCGADPAGAYWLAVLNPLVLIHLVAGAHNDALMLGLLAAGLVASLAGRPFLGTAAIALAAMVKAPAALALVVVAGLWAGRLTGRWPLPRAVLGTAAVAGGTAVVVTAVAGTGFGWVAALGTPVSAHNWSLSSAAGRLGALVLRLAGSDAAAWAADHAIAAWRWFGFAAAAAAALLVWSRRTRLGPVYALGLILGALVVFGPAIRPWYLLWGLIPLAAAAPPGVPRQWSAAACGALALAVLPDGFGPDLVEIGRAAAGGAVAVAIVLAADLTRPTETVTGTTREGTTTAAAGTAEYPP